MMPLSIQAGLWGLISGSALVLGALAGYYIRLDQRLVAGIMAFGSGVLISRLAALAGYAVFAHFDAASIAAITAVAAGAILAMLADTMISEAFETAHDYAGLIAIIGFLCAFILAEHA